jgi:transposase InsO family protein
MIVASVLDAQAAGARLATACHFAGVSARTVQRWRRRPGGDDCRRGPVRRPPNALTTSEEAQVVQLLTSERFRAVSPKQLVPILADEGVYLASESTLYRIQRRRGLRRPTRTLGRTVEARAGRIHRATGRNQVWSWDITWLPTTIRGRFLYLYLIMDVWSRRIVGWTVAERESSEIAAELVQQACRDQCADPEGLVLHSDNGNPMRGSTMLATLRWLGIAPSFSRPHVSDDNPYSEALFRTMKHAGAPAYPRRPFASLADARAWVGRFAAWYNGEHRHSGIRYVTPDERHSGAEAATLARRREVYETARRTNPDRWTRNTRDWSSITIVELNPERRHEAAA